MTPLKDFDSFFQNDFHPVLVPLEQQRKKVFWLSIGAFVSGIATVVLFIIAKTKDSKDLLILSVILLVVAIGVGYMFNKKDKIFVAEYKNKLVAQLIRYIDPSLIYKPDEFINSKHYSISGLYLQHYDRYSGSDFIEGKRGPVNFYFSELHTEVEVDTGKTSYWQTIFQGIFFLANFNKKFSSRTYVWSRLNPQLNGLIKIFSSFSKELEKVTLESSEFQKDFIVYSTDQVESRYILNPSVMERMMKLWELINHKISFSFIDANIYIAIPITKPVFEPRIFSSNYYANLRDYYNTINSVFNVMDELQLISNL